MNGIFIFDLNHQLIHHYTKIGGHSDFSKAVLSIDDKKNIWVIIENNIFQLKRNSNHLDNWKLIIQGNKNRTFNSLFHGLGKNLLIGKRGIFEIKETNKKIELIRSEVFKEYTNFEFRYLFNVDDQTFYAPFKGQKIQVYRNHEDSLQLRNTIDLNSETYDIFKSSNSSEIWLGTSKGLVKIDKDGRDSLIISSNSLEKNCNIYSVIEDNNEKLWLSTDCGIWFYDLTSDQTIKFTQANKLPSSIFLHSVSLFASDGSLWFDNTTGLTVFDPDSVKINSSSGAVFIDNFWVNNKEDKRILSANNNSKLKLDYTENKLDFQFRIIGLDNPSNASVKYRLKNYDDKWHRMSNGEVANYPKLSPNFYQLELIAIDPYNQEGESKIIDILISPPFWEEAWFRILGLLLFASLITLSVRLYYKRKIRLKEKSLEKQKTINAERDRIAKELHDEIGGGLSSILFISEDLHLEEKNLLKKELTERISVLTKEALNNMKDIIWALNNEQNTLNDLLIRIKNYTTDLLLDRQIQLDFQSDIQTKKPIHLGSEKKRNLLLIVKECLHNIIKHAKADSVKVSMIAQNKKLSIIIQDNGQGFDLTVKSNGDGLSNIKYRSEVIKGSINLKSSSLEGTIITIEVPLEP